MKAENLNSLTRKVIQCKVTASKHVSTVTKMHYYSKEYKHNNRRTAGSGVFYLVCAEVIMR
jgi:hypothetical protein